MYNFPTSEFFTYDPLKHLDLPKGFWGDPELLRSLAGFFNKSFNPSKPVLAEHIAVAPGAGGCIDALLFNICDPNDGVLIPAPFWSE
jgi:aspartate/methionine/tyrosine aminotransferase